MKLFSFIIGLFLISTLHAHALFLDAASYERICGASAPQPTPTFCIYAMIGGSGTPTLPTCANNISAIGCIPPQQTPCTRVPNNNCSNGCCGSDCGNTAANLNRTPQAQATGGMQPQFGDPNVSPINIARGIPITSLTNQNTAARGLTPTTAAARSLAPRVAAVHAPATNPVNRAWNVASGWPSTSLTRPSQAEISRIVSANTKQCLKDQQSGIENPVACRCRVDNSVIQVYRKEMGRNGIEQEWCQTIFFFNHL